MYKLFVPKTEKEKELAEIMGFEFVQDTGSAWGSWQPNEGRLNNEK